MVVARICHHPSSIDIIKMGSNPFSFFVFLFLSPFSFRGNCENHNVGFERMCASISQSECECGQECGGEGNGVSLDFVSREGFGSGDDSFLN